ncbi:MAG: hydrolase [Lentisphaerales bacterium]|jgi:nicotinamidase-related amidase|nr:MAG: hydrolase [Lentisphaerales bacterium]
MLSIESSVLVVVDVQVKLAAVMHQKDKLLANLTKLLSGMRVLEVPIVVTEQYPQGLGPTVPELTPLLTDCRTLSKKSFSCWGDDSFRSVLEEMGRKQIMMCGIESHVCVYQTVMDLMHHGFEVSLVADATSSRSAMFVGIAVERMRDAGCSIVNTEMVLFELLKTSDSDRFKEISKIVK